MAKFNDLRDGDLFRYHKGLFRKYNYRAADKIASEGPEGQFILIPMPKYQIIVATDTEVEVGDIFIRWEKKG